MGGTKEAENEVTETPLSQKQLEILKSRESFMNTFTIPELKNHLEEVKNLELESGYQTSPYMKTLSANIGNVRDQYQFQQDQLSLNLAKRGLEGSGVESNSLMQLASAEAQSVGNTMTQSALQAILERNAITDQNNQNALSKQKLYSSSMQNLLNLAPRPTTAAPQQMMQEPGKKSPLGATLGGGIQGAMIGGQHGGVYGAIAGGVIGAGSGYASAT